MHSWCYSSCALCNQYNRFYCILSCSTLSGSAVHLQTVWHVSYINTEVQSSWPVLLCKKKPAFLQVRAAYLLRQSRAVAQLVEAFRHKIGRPGFDFWWNPWKFSSDVILLSAFSSPVVHSASNRNGYQGISNGGKVRPAHTADNSAILVVPTVKTGWKPTIPSPLWISMTLPLPFMLVLYVAPMLVTSSTINGSTGWKVYTHTQFKMNAMGIKILHIEYFKLLK